MSSDATARTRHQAYLAFGSNMGDSIKTIEDALDTLTVHPDIKLLRTSGLYETKAMYVEEQADFVNGVCEPMDLLDACQNIEKSLGRKKTIDKGPRNIDLDILLYEDHVVSEPRLLIPHKLMLERAFVLQPLCELIPHKRPPPYGTRATYLELLQQLPALESPMSTAIRLTRTMSPIRAMLPTRRTEIMSVLNITPDSFSDGGKLSSDDHITLKRVVEQQIAAGATIFDVGGQSTRPNAAPVTADEETSRVLPAVKLIVEVANTMQASDRIAISVDTFRAPVAKAAVEAGAHIVNDVSAGLLDPDMLQTVAKLGCPIILMHMRGDPSSMNSQENTTYPNGLIATVAKELHERVREAERAGIPRWRIILDPGIGFAKTAAGNLELLRRLNELRDYEGFRGLPWLVGTSRKGFIGRITGVEAASERTWGTAAAVTAAVQGGADIVRVHDVEEMIKVALINLPPPWPTEPRCVPFRLESNNSQHDGASGLECGVKGWLHTDALPGAAHRVGTDTRRSKGTTLFLRSHRLCGKLVASQREATRVNVLQRAWPAYSRPLICRPVQTRVSKGHGLMHARALRRSIASDETPALQSTRDWSISRPASRLRQKAKRVPGQYSTIGAPYKPHHNLPPLVHKQLLLTVFCVSQTSQDTACGRGAPKALLFVFDASCLLVQSFPCGRVAAFSDSTWDAPDPFVDVRVGCPSHSTGLTVVLTGLSDLSSSSSSSHHSPRHSELRCIVLTGHTDQPASHVCIHCPPPKNNDFAKINHLAQYIRKHEKHLANSVNAPHKRPLTAPGPSSSSTSSRALSSTPASSTNPFATLNAYLGIGSNSIRPAKLFVTPNQLYYLLARFEELGVDVGSCNVRLENIQARPTSTNYVSFLTETPRPKGRRSFDQESIQSVSSVRSVVSSVWSNIGASLTGSVEVKREKQEAALREDIRYLYSAFTKIPTLKLAMDHRIRKIAGYEEFPFDMAVPLFAFKNLTHLEIIDCDYRTFHGWDRLADQLRILTVKRAGLEDVSNLLTDIVLDDIDQRRRRSSKSTASPIAYPSVSPRSRHAELVKTQSTPDSPVIGSRPVSGDFSKTVDWARTYAAPSTPPALRQSTRPRTRGISPSKASPGRRGSYYSHRMQRRTSGSSNGSSPAETPRGSTANLLNFGLLPPMKWRFLRHLNLPENGLTTISVESLTPVLSTLQSLDLSGNLFTEIPDALSSLMSLRALNLSDCMIDSLRSLAKTPLPAIAVLNLKGNRFSSIAGIERLVSLERLDIRDNRITDPTELARVTGMPEFRDVYVARNPFTKTHDSYRVKIFNLFRAAPGFSDDITIDGSGPGYNERKQLNDRVPENAPAPVGKTSLVDEVVIVHVSSKQGVQARAPRVAEAETEPARLSNAAEEGIPRRKKTPKRRIVEISQGDARKSQIELPDVGKLSLAGGDERPSAAGERASTAPKRPLPSAAREQHGGSAALASPVLLPERHERSETYRQRIEEFKKDYGNEWLSALGDADAAVNARRVQQEGSIKSGDGITSPTLAPISTGASAGAGRRLG
ncbi:hypothetical protein FH972_023762 [Carpinus fangiana]|uniref:Pterin-binding domain-containing protein n=1 Tax=Carpinus fangiana TaxID=176857 RepID=A0A5N6KWD8_9ROSI|nr:hypothetical protein FH972_023762 [Carpinus fangiana]